MFRSPQIVLFSTDVERLASFYKGLGFTETFRVPKGAPPIHIDVSLDGYLIGSASADSTRDDHGLQCVTSGQRAAVVLWTDDTRGGISPTSQTGLSRNPTTPRLWLDQVNFETFNGRISRSAFNQSLSKQRPLDGFVDEPSGPCPLDGNQRFWKSKGDGLWHCFQHDAPFPITKPPFSISSSDIEKVAEIFDFDTGERVSAKADRVSTKADNTGEDNMLKPTDLGSLLAKSMTGPLAAYKGKKVVPSPDRDIFGTKRETDEGEPERDAFGRRKIRR